MQFVKQSVIHASPERVFEFHEQPNALHLLTPTWESARVVQAAEIGEIGSEAIVEIKVLGPIKIRWIARHTVYDPPRLFEDVQVRGPFRSWRHRHIIESHIEGATLCDEMDYEPPFGFLGRSLAPLLVQQRLQKTFDYRHEITRRWCEGRKDEV